MPLVILNHLSMVLCLFQRLFKFLDCKRVHISGCLARVDSLPQFWALRLRACLRFWLPINVAENAANKARFSILGRLCACCCPFSFVSWLLFWLRLIFCLLYLWDPPLIWLYIWRLKCFIVKLWLVLVAPSFCLISFCTPMAGKIGCLFKLVWFLKEWLSVLLVDGVPVEVSMPRKLDRDINLDWPVLPSFGGVPVESAVPRILWRDTSLNRPLLPSMLYLGGVSTELTAPRRLFWDFSFNLLLLSSLMIFLKVGVSLDVVGLGRDLNFEILLEIFLWWCVLLFRATIVFTFAIPVHTFLLLPKELLCFLGGNIRLNL